MHVTTSPTASSTLIVQVRKAVLLLVNAVAHHNASMLIPLLSDLFELLFTSLAFKLERTVDLGPFKHKV